MHRIINKHGGEIWANAKFGKDDTFYIGLPKKITKLKLIMENREIEILLVEDSLDDAELTITTLRNNNLTTHIIHLMDGAAALDFLFGTGKYTGRNIENRPKVILLDLNMPKVSALEVLEKLSSNEFTKKIPVVVLT
jgi:two-component system response regulator